MPQGSLTSCILISCIFFALCYVTGKEASAIKIRPRMCTNALGEHGTCMFVWECIKKGGRQLGTCIDGFLVGSCCSNPDIEENIVPGADAGYSQVSPPKNGDEVKMKPASSNLHVTSVTFSSISIVTPPPLKIQTPSEPISTTTNSSSPGNSVQHLQAATGSGEAGDKIRDQDTNIPSTEIYRDCGLTTPQPKMKVVGGTNSAFGEWPWQVSVRRTSFFGFASTHRCGGAMLDVNWIITAGHCVDDLLKSQIRIRVGEFDFSTTREPYPYQERGVERKIVHPRYNFYTYEYDLALVKLDSPLLLQPHVKPICLPSQNNTLVGKNATITGWGRLSEGGVLPTMLQQVQVPIISNEKCKQMFLAAGRQENIPDIFMCAGYEKGGKDSCQGDSGGPLQIKGEDGRWFLAGIISWGIGCAEPNMPGVCTRIAKFQDWIRQNIT